MSFGLFKHIYQYFVPPEDPEPDARKLATQALPARSVGGFIILYDKEGEVVGYIPDPKSTQETKKPRVKEITDESQLNRTSILTMEENTASKAVKHPHNVAITKPFVPPNLSPTVPFETDGKLPSEWDGWPDGYFERDFTFHDVDDYNNLQVHWATKTHGHRGGFDSADSWEHGKKQHRECLGIIECDNPDCLVAIRPQTTRARINKQLRERCKCGAVLDQTKCDVKSFTWTYSKGVHFVNAGFHQHPRPGHLLHISKDEQVRFEAIVNAHPTVGPLGLIVGVPGVNGPGESVADISDVFVNAGRVGKERLKIKKGGQVGGGDAFISAFAKFSQEYPGFVIFSQLNIVTVISVQSVLMRTEMVKERLLDGPINGLVNDAAHGWWKERTSLLVMSSSYCPDLLCWVPGVISYTNGASAEHFKYHFLAVFQSIAHEASLKGHRVTDKLFAGVMDFSEAERSGFKMAFVEFWTLHVDSDQRSHEELSEAAGRLLRGCQEHFRAAVTRVARINGAVPPELKDAFTGRALSLLQCSNTEEFQLRAELMVRDFPKLKSWMEWWMRPAHASMLFQSERVMDIRIWDSIPKTTNAQEAMHWKIYSMCGRDHSFLEGMYALRAVANYYQRLMDAVSTGIPIRYGEPEPWKVKAAAIGRTKPSRAPKPDEKKRKKNDGRPPDTVIELLDNPTAKKATKKSRKSTKTPKLGPTAYRWSTNSCWLDASLQVLYITVTKKYDEFNETFQHLDPDYALGAFYEAMNARVELDLEEEDASGTLMSQRDQLRIFLKKKKVIKEIDRPESAVSWLHELVRLEYRGEYSLAIPYFLTFHVSLHRCSGSPAAGGSHVEITSTLGRITFFQVQISHYVKYDGLIAKLCDDRFSATKNPTPNDFCWRTTEGETLCPGRRQDIRELIVSIPIVLAIEVGDESVGLNRHLGSERQYWDFPATITPDSEDNAKKFGVIYDLIGYTLVNVEGTHFTARYISHDRKKIYTYDSLKHGGHPYEEQNATFKTHITGRNVKLPEGFAIWQAYYHLRGGLNGQRKFYETRTKQYASQYNLYFSEATLDKLPTVSYRHEGLHEMPAKDRFWLINPERAGTTEYIPDMPRTVPSGHEGPESEEETLPHRPLLETIDLTQLPRSSGSQESLPDSEFALNCRCGVTGDGNIVYHQEDGEVIQCDECRDWSHIACQRHGRASNLLPKDRFLCDSCDPEAMQHLLPQKRTSTRRIMRARTLTSKRLEDRLRPGRGALVRRGDFWYPVRVIQREGPKSWRVRWWRECQFAEGGIEPGSLATVSTDDIVDSLWLKRPERRKIRLGKWTHPHNLPTSEDILSDPTSINYTDEVHKALGPHKGPLIRLLTSPNSSHPEVSDDVVPAKKWLVDHAKSLEKTLIPHVGTLSVVERAQIANWFERSVSMTKELRIRWMGLLPIAHAHTLFIAYRMAKDPIFKSISKSEILRKAWEVQLTGSTAILREIDVDKECLESLEEEMFERTERTGISGNWQWGLDVGHHQDGWDPSFGVPENWDEKKRVGSESEREFGPDYIHFKAPTPELDVNTQIRARPKPRPTHKAKKTEN